jgi:hypothetical protein
MRGRMPAGIVGSQGDVIPLPECTQRPSLFLRFCRAALRMARPSRRFEVDAGGAGSAEFAGGRWCDATERMLVREVMGLDRRSFGR